MPSQSDKVRTPIPGLRQKVRNALRAAGFLGKFSVQHMRGSPPYFAVITKSGQTSLPISEFDGLALKLYRKTPPLEG